MWLRPGDQGPGGQGGRGPLPETQSLPVQGPQMVGALPRQHVRRHGLGKDQQFPGRLREGC